jgi:hypothetical protein
MNIESTAVGEVQHLLLWRSLHERQIFIVIVFLQRANGLLINSCGQTAVRDTSDSQFNYTCLPRFSILLLTKQIISVYILKIET